MDWSKLTSSTFEELAFFYAKTEYSEFLWVPTAKTRDGNKDGVFEETINLGGLYKGWYEAKYTKNTNTSIPASHMDSTLVSGILDGHVVCIIFITNGVISKSFCRRAEAILQPNRIKPYFVDGQILENWLYANDSIYTRFFSDKVDAVISETTEVTIDDFCVFDGIMSPSALTSPVKKLIENENYYLYISLRSNMKTSVKIRWDVSELIVLYDSKSKKTYDVVPGFNSFFIKVQAIDSYNGSMTIQVLLDDVLLDKYPIKKVLIEPPNRIQLSYSRQLLILQEIFDSDTYANAPNIMLSVEAKSGFGKSYLLEKLLHDISDKQKSVTSIKFSDRESENAVQLCKLILYVTFGMLYELSDEAFAELIKEASSLPFYVYNQLKEGTKNQLSALDVIHKVYALASDKKCVITSNNISFNHHGTYIIIDDVHKLSGFPAKVFSIIIDEVMERHQGNIVLLSIRPNEFNEPTLENKIKGYISKSWKLDNITPSDVYGSISNNISKDVAKIAELFPTPINVLHLFLLIRKLEHERFSCMTVEEKVEVVRSVYEETNIQNSVFVFEKIKRFQKSVALYLIYSVESGIPVEYLHEFDLSIEKEVDTLLDEQLIRLENNQLYPFHDTYIYAYKNISFDESQKNTLRSFMSFCVEKYNDESISSNILATLLEKHELYNSSQKNELYKMCIHYYESSRYSASKKVAFSLLPTIDLKAVNKSTLKEYDELNFELLFIYAMSIKYSESHMISDDYLNYICKISELKMLTPKERGITLETHSELLNNAIWELKKNDAAQQISYLEQHIITPQKGKNTINYETAYLNLLNRKMVYSAIFTDENTIESLYETAKKESEALEREDFVGYALMDMAKIIGLSNMTDSMEKLNAAEKIFSKYGHCRKRFLDCIAEKEFLQLLHNNMPMDELYNIQNLAYTEKMGHVYAKTSLKIYALEVIRGVNPELVNKKLDSLLLQYPDIIGEYRLHVFYNMIKSMIYYVDNNILDSLKWAKKYYDLTSVLTSSYMSIAMHNIELLEQPKSSICKLEWFNNNNDINAFWLDSRIW